MVVSKEEADRQAAVYKAKEDEDASKPAFDPFKAPPPDTIVPQIVPQNNLAGTVGGSINANPSPVEPSNSMPPADIMTGQSIPPSLTKVAEIPKVNTTLATAPPVNPPGLVPQNNADGSTSFVPARPTTLQGIHQFSEEQRVKDLAPVMSELEKAQIAQNAANQTAKEVAAQSSVLDQQKAADLVNRQNLEAKAQAIAQNNISQRIAARNAEIAKIPDVDPDRRSIPQKILGAIAMGLGTFGSSITHSQNTAMQIIQDQINGDVAAQKANIDKKWKMVNEHYKLDNDAELRDKFILQQHRDAKTFQWQLYDDAQKALAAKSGNAQTQANSQLLSAQVAGKIAGLDQETHQSMASDYMSEAQQRAAQAAAAQSRTLTLENKAEEVRKNTYDKLAEKYGPAVAEKESQRQQQIFLGKEVGNRDENEPKFVSEQDKKLMSEDLNGNKRPVLNEPALADWQKVKPLGQAVIKLADKVLAMPPGIDRERETKILNRENSRFEGRGRIDPQTNLFVPDETPGPWSLNKNEGVQALKDAAQLRLQAHQDSAFGTSTKPTGLIEDK